MCHNVTSPCGMTVRPTVTPAIQSDTASFRLYFGNQEIMGSLDVTVSGEQHSAHLENKKMTFGYLRSHSSSSCLSRNLSPVHLWESLLHKEVICDHYQLFHLPLDFLMPLIIPPTALLWNDCVGETEGWLTYHTYFGAGLTACNLNNKTHTTYTYTYSPHTTRYINIAHTLHSSSLYCHTSLGQTTGWPHEYTYFLALTLSDLIFSTAHKGKV